MDPEAVVLKNYGNLSENILYAQQNIPVRSGDHITVAFADTPFITTDAILDSFERFDISYGAVHWIIPAEFRLNYSDLFRRDRHFHTKEVPGRVGSITHIQSEDADFELFRKLSGYRRQKHLSVALKSLAMIIHYVGKSTFRHYLNTQAAFLTYQRGFFSISDKFCAKVSVHDIEDILSEKILGIPTWLMWSPYAELDIDIDETSDLEQITKNYQLIKKRVKETNDALKEIKAVDQSRFSYSTARAILGNHPRAELQKADLDRFRHILFMTGLYNHGYSQYSRTPSGSTLSYKSRMCIKKQY